MYVLGIILARAGSKGLADKCVRPLLGRAMIEYTFDHALAARRLCAVVLSTDSAAAAALARRRGIAVIDRPAALADDAARVDAVARHAVEWWEGEATKRRSDEATKGEEGTEARRHEGTKGVVRRSAASSGIDEAVDAVALLYGNIPVRTAGLIDRAIEKLEESGADSVRSVAAVTKQHPDWIHRLDGDRMTQFRPNGIFRRQDLEPLYYHDGAIAVVRRAALFSAEATAGSAHASAAGAGAVARAADGQAFLGRDRRAIVQAAEDAVDVDTLMDLYVAEAVLRGRHVGT